MAQDVPAVSAARQIQSVQTPMAAGQTGISYQQSAPSSATLKVYTDGFLFCGNPGVSQPGNMLLSFLPAHEDQKSSPAHAWKFAPSIADTFGYNAGQLNLVSTTLVCLSATKNGAVASGLYEGIFDNGYDSSTASNYPHLVNWNPTPAIDWTAPDWTQIPVDACGAEAYQQARVPENVACSAVTGVRGGTTTASVRAPTMWTVTDGVSFTYLFRVDARIGAPAPGQVAALQVPVLTGTDADAAVTGLTTRLRDAYDSTYLSDGGSYCFLNSPPTTLGSTACSGATTYQLSGALDVPLSVAAPPVGPGSTAFYVVVNRPIQGGPPQLTSPVVGASLLVDGAMSAESGNMFTGDDVVFGFMPTSTGFPWMTGN